MKKLLLAATAICALGACDPAFAEEVCYPPIEVQIEQVVQEIRDEIIDNFCEQQQPKGEPGQIVIYYERDANGQCVAKVKDLR